MKTRYLHIVTIAICLFSQPVFAVLPDDAITSRNDDAIHFFMFIQKVEVAPAGLHPIADNNVCIVSGTIGPFVDGNERSRILNHVMDGVRQLTVSMPCPGQTYPPPPGSFAVSEQFLKKTKRIELWGDLHLSNDGTYFFTPFDIKDSP